jgi:hypothetical protein
LSIADCGFRIWKISPGTQVNGQPSEGVKKSTRAVILSGAKDLHLSVFKGDNADASLRST